MPGRHPVGVRGQWKHRGSRHLLYRDDAVGTLQAGIIVLDVTLPAYALNRTKRLIKTPKLYWADSGLCLHLSGVESPGGAHLENHVFSDLLAWRDAHVAKRPELSYWRTTNGEEVDFVVESGGELVAIEVKAGRRPRAADAEDLRIFRDEYGDAVRGCLLLHGGDEVEVLGDRIVAAPWWSLS